MATPPGTVAGYVRAIFSLLPPGRFWRHGDTSTRLGRTISAIAEEAVRTHDRGLELIEELDPRTAVDMLDAWERLLGLPDPCVPEALRPTTLADRQAAAHAKWTARGGQSPAYFENLALSLGIGPPVNVVCCYLVPFRCGVGRMGDRLDASDSGFVWKIEAPASTSTSKRAQLECLVQRYKPAHTFPEFDYSL